MTALHRLPWASAAGASLLIFAACSTSGPVPPPSPAALQEGPAEGAVPLGVHWVRTAAEHRMLFEEVYRWAGDKVEAEVSEGVAPGPWAVILDADETVLDNSTYQLRRARQGLGYTPESWNEWVREEAAPALPGAVTFVRRVRALGGHIAIVTNRDEVVCDATRRNLASVGVAADVVLCRQPGPSEKESRFRAVEEGTTPVGLPPLHVVAWIGDNIHDFPGGNQALGQAGSEAAAEFGGRFFVLPNPMYGSWTSNPGG